MTDTDKPRSIFTAEHAAELDAIEAKMEATAMPQRDMPTSTREALERARRILARMIPVMKLGAMPQIEEIYQFLQETSALAAALPEGEAGVPEGYVPVPSTLTTRLRAVMDMYRYGGQPHAHLWGYLLATSPCREGEGGGREAAHARSRGARRSASSGATKAQAGVMTSRDEALALAKTMQCNCDLDNWEPDRRTGHSSVCRIHKAALL